MSKNEVLKETGISTLKGALSAIPFVGGAINEYAFEARGRIKQARVNSFVNEFAEYIKQFQKVELSIEQIQKEEFGDFFEELLIRVSKNHSESKKQAFKKLLTNQLLKPMEIDYAELLCDIIATLHEKQILILSSIINSDPAYIDLKTRAHEKREDILSYKRELTDAMYGITERDDLMIDPKVNAINRKIEEAEAEYEKLNRSAKDNSGPFTADYYHIPGHEFYYLVQDLANKGLITDVGTRLGAEPFSLFEINQLGIDLIEAIK